MAHQTHDTTTHDAGAGDRSGGLRVSGAELACLTVLSGATTLNGVGTAVPPDLASADAAAASLAARGLLFRDEDGTLHPVAPLASALAPLVSRGAHRTVWMHDPAAGSIVLVDAREHGLAVLAHVVEDDAWYLSSPSAADAAEGMQSEFDRGLDADGPGWVPCEFGAVDVSAEGVQEGDVQLWTRTDLGTYELLEPSTDGSGLRRPTTPVELSEAFAALLARGAEHDSRP